MTTILLKVTGGQVFYKNTIYRRNDEFEATEPLSAGLEAAIQCGQICLVKEPEQKVKEPEQDPAPEGNTDNGVQDDTLPDAGSVNPGTEAEIDKKPEKALVTPRRGRKPQ